MQEHKPESAVAERVETIDSKEKAFAAWSVTGGTLEDNPDVTIERGWLLRDEEAVVAWVSEHGMIEHLDDRDTPERDMEREEFLKAGVIEEPTGERPERVSHPKG